MSEFEMRCGQCGQRSRRRRMQPSIHAELIFGRIEITPLPWERQPDGGWVQPSLAQDIDSAGRVRGERKEYSGAVLYTGGSPTPPGGTGVG